MEFTDSLTMNGIRKQYGSFALDISELHIPKGFVTALVGENGAGKSTLLSILSGILLDYTGDVCYFGNPALDVEAAKERIGFQAASEYFMPGWTVRQVVDALQLLFPGFDKQVFDSYVQELDIPVGDGKKVTDLSDGNQIKLILAGLFARKTDILILDEPASPLDPLMREKLCDLLRRYIEAGGGERSVFFSTHNVADMEPVTDYLMVMENGKIVEQGFIPELRDKYVLVKGEAECLDAVKDRLVSSVCSGMGFEGLCLTEEAAAFSGNPGISVEIPTLSQICVGVMRRYSKISGEIR